LLLTLSIWHYLRSKVKAAQMGHFHALPDAVAVAVDRLVAVVRIESDGGVVVRDLANGGLSTISASELRLPPTSSDPTVTSVASLVHATDAQWELARRREAVIAALVDTSNLANKVRERGVTRVRRGLWSPVTAAQAFAVRRQGDDPEAHGSQ